MDTVASILHEAHEKADAEHRRWEAQRLSDITGFRVSRQVFEQIARDCLRPASRRDYAEWLRAYLESGGRPTHVYNYPFPSRDWYVARRPFHLVELYGANSVQVIVPDGLTFEAPRLGHNNVYLFDGPTVLGGWVPLYPDVEALLKA